MNITSACPGGADTRSVVARCIGESRNVPHPANTTPSSATPTCALDGFFISLPFAPRVARPSWHGVDRRSLADAARARAAHAVEPAAAGVARARLADARMVGVVGVGRGGARLPVAAALDLVSSGGEAVAAAELARIGIRLLE